jgi:succinate dehydrogenase / fumarate reductase cytochrome b subunit
MKTRHKKNQLGIIGWGLGGRWGIERYVYTIHRITGLSLLAYFLLHIFVTYARVMGKESWEATMAFLDHPVFKIGELLVFFAFCLHALNGLRLVLIEFGIAVGKPEEPIYPYRSSLNTQRPLLIGCMMVAGLFIVLGGYNFLRLTGLSQ